MTERVKLTEDGKEFAKSLKLEEPVRSTVANIMREEMLKHLALLGIEYKSITCDECSSNGSCEWAYDTYNTDGDCLAMK